MLYEGKRKHNRIISIIGIILFLLSLFSPLRQFSVRAEGQYIFDSSPVTEDLQTAEDFSLIKYPWDFTGAHQPGIISLVEYGYGTSAYALYVYFYNPSNLDIVSNSQNNRVQMGVSYDTEHPIGRSKVTGYETFELAFCNKSEGAISGLYWKFRVVDHQSADGKTIGQRVISVERRYDISGITVQANGRAREFTVGGSFTFTGTGSSLRATSYNKLETVQLNVNQTFYRTDTSAAGNNHQNQLNSVYFSIPKRLIDNYGALQKIKAEWYEYNTQPIVVLHDYADYLAYKTYFLGEMIDDSTLTDNAPMFSTDYSLDSFYAYPDGIVLNMSSGEVGAQYGGTLAKRTPFSNYYNSSLYILFNDSEGRIDRETIIDYLYNPDVDLPEYPDSCYITGARGRTCTLLYTDISEERQAVDYVGNDHNHKLVNIDAGDKIDLISMVDSLDGWNSFWYKFYGGQVEESVRDIPTIVYGDYITDKLTLSDMELSEQVYIDIYDVDDFRAWAETLPNDEIPVLFRFANTDYYSAPLRFWNTYNWFLGGIVGGGEGPTIKGYMAQESVFLNFDVIDLTFRADDGLLTIIPAVADPIDHVSAITGVAKEPTMWEYIWSAIILLLAVIGLFIGLWLIKKILKVFGMIPNPLIELIIILAFGVAVVFGVYYYGTWIYGLIHNIGALW